MLLLSDSILLIASIELLWSHIESTGQSLNTIHTINYLQWSA